MLRFVTCCSLLAALFSFGACGTESGQDEGNVATLTQGLSVQYDATGIHSIDWEGTGTPCTRPGFAPGHLFPSSSAAPTPSS